MDGQSSGHKHLVGENDDGHFLHTLPIIMLRSEQGFAIPETYLRKALPLSWGCGVRVLDIAVSTQHTFTQDVTCSLYLCAVHNLLHISELFVFDLLLIASFKLDLFYTRNTFLSTNTAFTLFTGNTITRFLAIYCV